MVRHFAVLVWLERSMDAAAVPPPTGSAHGSGSRRSSSMAGLLMAWHGRLLSP